MDKVGHLALIDLGSSTVKLNTYDLSTKKMLYKDAKTVNMAENFYPNLIITTPAIKRVLEALKRYKAYINKEDIKELKLVTTGVARKAKNTVVLRDKITKELGWTLEVITGEQEAELFYNGVVYDFDPKVKIAAINVGGGSTEITFGNSKKIRQRLSFPIGVSSLNEKFLQTIPASNDTMDSMFNFIHDQLRFDINEVTKPDLLVHTGGELEYMEITKHPLEDSHFSPSHPKQISRAMFAQKYAEIKKMSKEELNKFMPNNPKWMDGAVACTAIALAIADELNVDVIVPSNKNLTYGLLLKYKEHSSPTHTQRR